MLHKGTTVTLEDPVIAPLTWSGKLGSYLSDMVIYSVLLLHKY